MTDFLLLEQLHRKMKDIVKPRLIFRKGISARGFFRPYMSMSEYTKATIFSSLDEITPVMVRFSAMMGDKGTADTIRNIKGMDVKFRSEDKEHDMMCRSLPVSFVNSKEKLFLLIDAFSRYEAFDCRCAGKFWELVTEHPEAINCTLHYFSREGISDSFIDTTWYSVNSAQWKNEKGHEFPVRYRWMPVSENEEKRRFIDRNAAEFMAGYEPDRAINQLKRQIACGKFPIFELQIQMRCKTGSEGAKELSERTGCTLLWEENQYPYMAVGMMKLTKIAEDYRKDCDLLSFAPYNTIDGMDVCHEEFTDIMDYMYRIEAAERGSTI